MRDGKSGESSSWAGVPLDARGREEKGVKKRSESRQGKKRVRGHSNPHAGKNGQPTILCVVVWRRWRQ